MKKISIQKIILLTLIVIAVVFLGYLRDFIFVHTNREISIQYYKIANDDLPSSIAWMKNFNYLQLMKFKWFFTFLFSGIYLGLTLLITKVLFEKKKFFIICIYAYIALFLVAFIFMGGGYFIHSFILQGYDLSRSLMHITQSPLVMMVLIPAFKLSEKTAE